MEDQSSCFQELTQQDGIVSEINYNEYYKKQLVLSAEFQDFICIQLIKKGIVLSNMSSKKFQISIGENLQGFEIKNDNLFRKTHNLYIEIAEKSNVKNEFYVSSGIFRHDNTWIYCIGDYDSCFLIQKKVLQAMQKMGKYKTVENALKTSKGFLLPVSEAQIYFNEIIFNQI